MLESHGETDVGQRRQLNEDSILVGDDLFLVCDGMGGHKAGEVASKIAVDVIAGFLQRTREDQEFTWPFGFDKGQSYDANRLTTAIKLANRSVFRSGASAEEYSGMGTTVVAALIPAGQPVMTYGHVGDSRIYLLRAGSLLQLSSDDSWDNAVPDGNPDLKHILLKALGAREEVEFPVATTTLQPGDTVLLCSDGLTNMVSDTAITEIIGTHRGRLEAACRALLRAANAAGGRDNISALLLRYSP